MDRYEQKRRFFDEVAPQWQHGAFDADGLAVARWILRRAGVRAGMTVVEPGCGAGRMTTLLAERVGESGRVIAADVSERMLSAARRNVPAGNVEFRGCAAEEIALPSGSVDIVLCFDVFPHFDEPGRALDAFRRVLAGRGRLVIAHYPGRQRVNAIHREAGRAVGADRLPGAKQMRRMLREHGFAAGPITDEPDRYFVAASPRG